MKPTDHPLNDRIKDMNLTHEQFAARCGLSPTTIENIVTGFTRSKGKYYAEKHHHDTVLKIAKGLKCSVREAERLINEKTDL